MTYFWSLRSLAIIAALVLLTNGAGTAFAGGEAAYEKARASFEAGNPAEAAEWLEKAVAQGHPAAHLPLAAMYRDGHGVDQDHRRAIALFTRAAEYGYPSAQFSLGVMYRLGEGVRRDYAEAVKWYRKAANQGDPEAQNSLGVAHESGRGVKSDLEKAYMWYEVAAGNGSKRGENNRRRLSRKLSTEELPKAKKLSITCLQSNYQNCG